ncbi:hypothetical protein GCU56_04965 [Geodermatophilus sabuli]|uniref:Polymer-forming cytoskeletal protein n=1 Tax=Geodermatophilus sabuli TaxID=1564158 RepID=A0A7K3VZ92_9ACTN|nr:polymer-forming cytoskeletal protein [Geodermatophilus sabuli]NEK57224.1 hypothetical protein [Geodermatophilus sabuli]
MFEKLTGDVQGPLEVNGALEIDGTLHGGADVTGTLDLRGACYGPLQVRLDGHADVEAVVHGDVLAHSGRLRLRGIVEGILNARPEADVRFAVGTILNGRQLQADGSFVPVEGPFRLNIPDDAVMMRLQPDATWAPVD